MSLEKMLPPTEYSFGLLVRMCLYQLMIWRKANIPNNVVQDPVGFGYERPERGTLQPQLMRQSPAAPALLNNLVCECTNSCAERCTCVHNDPTCMAACKCEVDDLEDIVWSNPSKTEPFELLNMRIHDMDNIILLFGLLIAILIVIDLIILILCIYFRRHKQKGDANTQIGESLAGEANEADVSDGDDAEDATTDTASMPPLKAYNLSPRRMNVNIVPPLPIYHMSPISECVRKHKCSRDNSSRSQTSLYSQSTVSVLSEAVAVGGSAVVVPVVEGAVGGPTEDGDEARRPAMEMDDMPAGMFMLAHDDVRPSTSAEDDNIAAANIQTPSKGKAMHKKGKFVKRRSSHRLESSSPSKKKDGRKSVGKEVHAMSPVRKKSHLISKIPKVRNEKVLVSPLVKPDTPLPDIDIQNTDRLQVPNMLDMTEAAPVAIRVGNDTAVDVEAGTYTPSIATAIAIPERLDEEINDILGINHGIPEPITQSTSAQSKGEIQTTSYDDFYENTTNAELSDSQELTDSGQSRKSEENASSSTSVSPNSTSDNAAETTIDRQSNSETPTAQASSSAEHTRSMPSVESVAPNDYSYQNAEENATDSNNIENQILPPELTETPSAVAYITLPPAVEGETQAQLTTFTAHGEPPAVKKVKSPKRDKPKSLKLSDKSNPKRPPYRRHPNDVAVNFNPRKKLKLISKPAPKKEPEEKPATYERFVNTVKTYKPDPAVRDTEQQELQHAEKKHKRRKRIKAMANVYSTRGNKN